MEDDKKTIWSLQHNKRKPEERDQFKPTGKTKGSNSVTYGLVAFAIIFVVSLLLVWMSPKTLTTCFTDTYCISSNTHFFGYALYVAFTIVLIILAIMGAYIVGKKLGERFKI
ncbi:MAG: hypothetical protein BM564_00925 [Bacteroidetes bacterium MedPE-SWsnd-G2]|nr:MAG: hypothetical protein BM564_00925 [Bacteroidetes bacterium MedPE-SWsnd-G2]